MPPVHSKKRKHIDQAAVDIAREMRANGVRYNVIEKKLREFGYRIETGHAKRIIEEGVPEQRVNPWLWTDEENKLLEELMEHYATNKEAAIVFAETSQRTVRTICSHISDLKRRKTEPWQMKMSDAEALEKTDLCPGCWNEKPKSEFPRGSWFCGECLKSGHGLGGNINPIRRNLPGGERMAK